MGLLNFRRAYDLIRSNFRQYCLAHLLREIHDVDARNQSAEWQGFSKRLRRLIADALRLCSRKDHFSEKEYQSRNRRLDSRLEDLVSGQSAEDADVKRLTGRLAR